MYKKTEETYFLSPKDKLVMTYENGHIKILINNEIIIVPSIIDLKVIESGVASFVDGKVIKEVTALSVHCEV